VLGGAGTWPETVNISPVWIASASSDWSRSSDSRLRQQNIFSTPQACSACMACCNCTVIVVVDDDDDDDDCFTVAAAAAAAVVVVFIANDDALDDNVVLLLLVSLIVFRYVLSGWWRGSVVERRSLAGELSLSCARPAADG